MFLIGEMVSEDRNTAYRALRQSGQVFTTTEVIDGSLTPPLNDNLSAERPTR
jgi:hypothetical protein